MEHVNHPKHYNQHPAGIECIAIIRHYTCDIANAVKYLWRAGLKPEAGKLNAEKELEDLEKALWYIDDYRKAFPETYTFRAQDAGPFTQVTGYDIYDVIAPYDKNVGDALYCLLLLGIIRHGKVYAVENRLYYIDQAAGAVRRRIADLEETVERIRES